MAGKKGQKKRFWSDEEKVSICAPGVSVAQVARRYAMNIAQLYAVEKRVSDLLCMSNPVHALPKGSMND
ncbi:hypothetical protein LCGC14_2481790 [marine sediment metagenome]|uniref:Transposase n=1 Tax=marine sediment metagenome TaxID=412755 RepID=A0A0F9B7C4_9ZZZZ